MSNTKGCSPERYRLQALITFRASEVTTYGTYICKYNIKMSLAE
jgi:hypothetical protein